MWSDWAKSVWSRSNSVSIFSWTICTIFTATFCWKPHWKLVPKIWAVEGCQKYKETKAIYCFIWVYLKINISEFRLILLDHITYVDWWHQGCHKPSTALIDWLLPIKRKVYWIRQLDSVDPHWFWFSQAKLYCKIQISYLILFFPFVEALVIIFLHILEMIVLSRADLAISWGGGWWCANT